ncbi:S-type pyocin domain-containing protein [Pseudomonas sp. V88_4]|uniref:S-type pyocin domain-containing protein n=1 Tax=Pseudomonas sp. V88_4 TaxID=3044229 RepID=UPI00249EC2E6|nr:S-type pyocin domain-containing protein [Pseudomonas sp. V88_4]MDI3401160.1 S-type pyocin domain-containing protein [Pseudomonas sp. V88_4]
MSDIENYLGPHKQTGPGRYELAPIPVKGVTPVRLGQGGFFSGSWGLNEGPHRGTGQGSGKLDPLTPFIWNDLMQEQQNAQAYIDLEYAGVFSNIGAASNNEVGRARQAASAGLSAAQKVKADQEITIQVIHSKLLEYRAHTEIAYSLYGHNPFFLMKDLSFKKIRDSLALPVPDVSVAYAAIDRAYRSAMELRRLSWVMAIIANQLPELAARRSQVEAATQTTRDAQQILSAERLSVVNLETNIRLHFLPGFLVERIAAAAGSTGGSLSQTLTNYKIAADNIRAVEQAAVRPYAIANPAINAPLSKPELEALKNLVDLQATTDLGKRWQDYHASLLHSESARHMAAAADAFAGLIARAQEAERLQEQIRIARELEARHLQEQARIAAEVEARRVAEEQARIAAVAEARRLAEEQARIAAEAIRNAHTFRAPGVASATGPLFMTSAGVVAVAEAAAASLPAAVRSAIAGLGSLAASVGAGAVVGVSALVYSSKLGNGELPDRYAFSTPLSDLAPDFAPDLHAIAAAGGTVDMPFRVSSKTDANGQSEVFVVKTDGRNIPSAVRVVAASYDTGRNVYTATTSDVPPRTLTWTPIVNPGNSSTTSPAGQPDVPAYTGATVVRVEGRLDSFPGVFEAGFDDYVLVFPQDSGLPPNYTMFRDRREDPGVTSGVGQAVSGNWLGSASQGEGAPVPAQIADQLRGREFRNFRAFREAFWKAVAGDPELAAQFKKQSLSAMEKGKSPYAPEKEWAGEAGKFELHHKIYISNDGSVYGLENISVVTPKRHKDIHGRGW